MTRSLDPRVNPNTLREMSGAAGRSPAASRCTTAGGPAFEIDAGKLADEARYDGISCCAPTLASDGNTGARVTMQQRPATPQVFVGSSQEGQRFAYAVQQNIEEYADVTIWDQGIFDPSRLSIVSLSDISQSFDFAVFIVSPEDKAHIRGSVHFVARDNIIFELGVFMGSLGRDRIFMLLPRGATDFHLPTDLAGLEYLEFDAERETQQAALGPACFVIIKKITSLSAKQPALLTIFVEAPSGARFQAEVPHDVTIAKLASDFFESQGWPAQDEHSTAVVELVDSSDPDHTKRLGGALTFTEAGIRSGDTLRVFPESRAGCFLGNVPVTLSNGREKPFHDVVVGDELLSFCLDTGHLRRTNVTHVYKGIADHFFDVNSICHVTEAHPFWCDNQWKKVCQLAIGDVLTTVRGEHIQIKSLEFHNQPAIVYNLHLTSGKHTFFAGGFLVHNMDYKAMLTSVSKGYSQTGEELERNIDAISLKLAQIDTIKTKVNELEFKFGKVAEAFELLGTYLRRVHFSPKGKQEHFLESEEFVIAEITLRGSLENFGEIQSKNLANTIAKMGIPTHAIRVINIEKGSVLVTLEMPEKSALELMKWFINRNPVIYELKIEKIELRPLVPIKHDDVIQLPGGHIRILFLAANPYGTSKLRLDQEVREIDDALLQKAEFRERFEIVQQWAVRIADLQTHFLRFRPPIVHFCGHGSESSEIVIEDTDGKSKPVTERALSNLFALLKDNIRCVVLNACYSESQAQGISEHIECVVGMSKEIGDVAAISFAKSFYQALGYGRSVESAFELGVAQLDLEKVNEQDVPKLVTKDKNASKMKFV